MTNDELLNRYLDGLNTEQALEAVRIEDEETAILFRTARRLKVARQEKTIVPDPDFSRALERQLLVQMNEMTGQQTTGESLLRRYWVRLARPIRQHRWATVALGILLALAVALGVAGPQRVWAQIQRLLSYVPGVGFVDLEQARVLAVPVEVTRDGVTLRIEQVLVLPDRTGVVIRSEGLTPEDQLWPNGRRGEVDFQAWLRLPDGHTLAPVGSELRFGAGTLRFPALPEGVYHVTLGLLRLPLVPAGAAPEMWTVPLNLRPATGELIAEIFPQPYAPTGVSDTHHDVTLRVLTVAHSPEETLIRLQVEWPNANWEFNSGSTNQLPQLRDDLGHTYREITPSSVSSVVQLKVEATVINPKAAPALAPEVSTDEYTLAFASVSPSARRLTLYVDELAFNVSPPGSFSVDLGDNPQAGHFWPLDEHLTISGFPVHITGVRLRQAMIGPPDRTRPAFRLEFDFDVQQGESHILNAVLLQGPLDITRGSESGSYSFEARLQPSLILETLPDEPFLVELDQATLLIRGPWTLTWNLRAP